MGQESVVSILEQALSNDRIAPAYLFSGPRGVGKTSSARIFAKAASCLSEDFANRPCGECGSCKALSESSSMDIMEIDGASHTGVDDVRQIIESIAYRPGVGKRNVYIIDEVHMLSNAAFNALLKTLEEPPSHALFLFATTEPEKIPATILSRVQRLELRRLSETTIFESIESVSKKEKIKVSTQILHQVAAAADGALRDAQTLLEQLVLLSGGKEVQSDLVDQFLGTIGTEQEIQLLELTAKKDIDEILNRVSLFFEKGKDLSKLAQRLLLWVRCSLLARSLRSRDIIEQDLAPEFLDRLHEAFKAWSIDDLDRLFEVFWQANERLKRSLSTRISLESCFIRACRLAHTSDVQTLIDRIDSMQSAAKSLEAVGGLSPSAPPAKPSPAARATTPKPQTVTDKPAAEKKPIPRIESAEDLMSALKDHKGGIFALVRCSRKQKLQASKLVLDFPKGHFALKQMREGSVQKELLSFLKEAGSQITSIEFVEGGDDPHKSDVMKRNFIKEAKKEMLNDDVVNKALSKMKGKIDSVTVEGIKT